MTIEELSNGLKVPVNVNSYIELDAIYLDAGFDTPSCFIEALRDYFPTREEREQMLDVLKKLHSLRSSVSILNKYYK